jgi:hypothetical protein
MALTLASLVAARMDKVSLVERDDRSLFSEVITIFATLQFYDE